MGVVALLKKTGASTRLTYLITGEALLNDGSALVLYSFLFSLIEVDAVAITPVSVIIYFLKVVFISPLLGIAFGIGALVSMSYFQRRMEGEDKTMQIAITLCCAYLSFFTAQYNLSVSGVICCCTAGVVLARFAPPLLLEPESMHSVWSTIEWIGNTLIFTLAGLIIGRRSIFYITTQNAPYLLVVYVFVFLLRLAMLVLCYPVLRQMGKKYTVSEVLFMTWGGLRGAVSMALALSLVQSVENGSTVIADEGKQCVYTNHKSII